MQKKILLISYFYLPGNFAGSYRIAGFAQHLNEFGYYPVVITRRWDSDIQLPMDMSKSTGQEIIHRKYDSHEVYYLPYKANLRDRIYTKYGENRFAFLRKTLSFIELIGQRLSLRFIPYANFYSHSLKLLKTNDFHLIITSGSPFVLFKICYWLHKKTGVKWIADYRDEWTAKVSRLKANLASRFIALWDKPYEKKWVKSSEAIISVSENITRIISEHVGKKGYCIMNGFEESDYPSLVPKQNQSEFHIVYNGTLYSDQPIEIFLEAWKKIVEKYRDIIHVHISFPGVAIDLTQKIRLIKTLENYENYYTISGRLPKQEVIDIQMRAHLLLIVGYPFTKGIFSSKVFEYLACKRPIILCPSDQDVLENLIKKTNSGICVNTIEDTYNFLCTMIDEYIQTGQNVYEPNIPEIEKYTRKNQTMELARIIDSILS